MCMRAHTYKQDLVGLILRLQIVNQHKLIDVLNNILTDAFLTVQRAIPESKNYTRELKIKARQFCLTFYYIDG